MDSPRIFIFLLGVINVKRQIICLYIGVIIGTLIYNFGIHIEVINSTTFGLDEYLRLLLYRSVEVVIIIFLLDKFRAIWDILSGMIGGIIIGYLLSAHVINCTLIGQILYSYIALIIVILYLLVFNLIGFDYSDGNDRKIAKLHNYYINNIIIIAILLINTLLELKIVKKI